MSTQELSLLEKLSDRIGGDPDKELSPAELSIRTGVSVEAWKMRRQTNRVWANAFYAIGAKDYRTTMRRIWKAQDEMAKVTLKKAA